MVTHRSESKLLYLMMVTFVVVGIYSISIPQAYNLSKPLEDVVLGVRDETPPKIIPHLKSDASELTVSSESIYAIDIDSDQVLLDKQSNMPLLPASTAKIVSALVALDFYNPDDILSIFPYQTDGQRLYLPVGESFTARDILYGLLLHSANDAAEALAQNYPGGRNAFIAAMNLKAEEAELTLTNFTHPAGLDEQNQYTTAHDLVTISRFALKDDLFSHIVSTKYYTMESMDKKHSYKLKNINELLFEDDGIKGIKTGWTENAKENLVTYYDKDGKRILIAVLRSDDRFGDTKKVLDWILTNYTWQEESLATSI